MTKQFMKNKIILSLLFAFVVFIVNYLLWLHGKDIVALLVLVFYIIHTLYDISVQYRKKDDKDVAKVKFLYFYLIVIMTQTMLLPYLYPTFIRTELHKDPVKGQENISFYADSEIIEPINLKPKDTYANLVNQTDYFCNSRFVYIAYPFANSDLYNEEIAQKGVVFTYKTRSWRWGKFYNEYNNYLSNIQNLMHQKQKQTKQK